jgi:hypothetical protein
LTIRFLASLLLIECLYYSGASRLDEIRAIRDALTRKLGGPWDWNTNLTCLASVLSAHEISAVDGLFLPTVGEVKPWLTIEASLPEKSSLWQWNKEQPKPEKNKPKAVTPEKGNE